MIGFCSKVVGSVVVAVWLSVAAYAQRYHFEQYEVADGLAQSSVNHFLQDRYGYLWVATAGGVSRFDGNDFISFGLPDSLASNYVSQLLETQDHRLALATYDGLSIYDGQTFRNYQAVNEQGKPLKVKRVFEHTDGRLLLLCEANRLAYFDRDSITLLPVPRGLSREYFSDMVSDSHGGYWVATYDGQLLRFDGQAWKVITQLSGSTSITGLYNDPEGTLWLVTEQPGLYTYDPQQNKIIPYRFDHSVEETIFSVALAADGYCWVGTNNGVFRFDPKNGRIDPNSHGLQGTIVRQVYADREGSVWFGTLDQGMFQFRGDTFMKIQTEDGLHDKAVMSLTRDQSGHFWFGYLFGGLDRYDGEVTHYEEQAALKNKFISTMVEDSLGQLWLGTNDGIIRYDGQHFRTVPADTLLGRRVISSLRDRQQRLWFGTRAGPVYYDQGNFSTLASASGCTFSLSVNVMYELQDGRLVFGTEQGMYIQDSAGVRPLVDKSQHDKAPILAITQDTSGKVWYATINGRVCQYDLHRRRLVRHHTARSFPQSVVYSMATASDGSLVFGTQRGILRLLLNEQGEVLRFLNYGQEDGFLGVEANMNAVYQAEDSSIWFGTVDGVYRFDPKPIRMDSSQAVSPHLTDIKLYYEDTNWQEQGNEVSPWFGLPGALNLNHRQNHLVFSYKAVCLKSPSKVQYQFKLDNFDEEWSPITDRQEAVYANIPPGSYSFRVRAQNAQGFWSELAQPFSLVIAPPFWKTWWFYLVAAALGALTVRGYISQKLRSERRQRTMLTQEVAKRTEEIHLLNENLEKRVNERTHALEQSKHQLAHQEREYRLLVNNLREIIFKTDTEGRFTFLNHQWASFTGYALRESLHLHFSQIVHPAHRDEQLLLFQQLMQQKIPYVDEELRLLKKDQSVVWGRVSVRLEFDEDGAVRGTTGSLMDIDQRMNMEFALKASEEKYRFLAENTQDIITLQNAELRYTYVSPRIGEMTDYSPQEMIGQAPFDYLHPDDRSIYEAFLADPDPYKSMEGETVRFRNKSGDYRHYEVFLKPIFNEREQFVSYISSSRDVTHKVQLHREIEEVRKKVAKDFHDEMGNNLASISVLSQIIQKQLGTQKNGIHHLLVKIDTASKNLFYGTRDFIWAIDPKNDDLREVYVNLKDFGEELFENTGVNFLACFNPCEEQDRWKIPSGWSRQLVLIFKEALTNALKYAQADTVQLIVEVCPTDFQATLTDDGVGFDPEKVRPRYRGIRNMQERAQKIKADFTIHTQPQCGTQVTLKGKITLLGG